MAWLGGMLQGFTQESGRIRQQNQAEDDLNRQHEQSIFSTLLNSPDPETKKLAIAGMLHSGDPRQRQGGLAGWVGKMRASPYMGMIQSLSPMLESQESTPSPEPRAQSGYMPGAPPASGAAAQPATSPTEVGAPPPATVEPTPSPLTADVRGPGARPAPTTRTVSKPRQVFQTPEGEAEQRAIGTQQGDVEGRVAGRVAAGMSREEALALERQNMRGATGGVQSIAGAMPDGSPAFGVFDRVPGSPTYGKYLHPETHVPLEGFQPRTSTGSTSLGADREAIAREIYGKPAAQLKGEQMAHVDAVVQQRRGQLTPSQALAAAGRMIPNASVEQQTSLADALAAGTAAPIGSSAPTGVGTPPPAVSGSTAPAEAAPPGLTPAAGTPPPAPTSAAKPGIGAQVSPTLASASKETGKVDPVAKQREASITELEGTFKTVQDLVPKVFPAVKPGFKGNVQTTLALGKQSLGKTEDYAALNAAIASTMAGIVRLNGVTQRLNQKELDLAQQQMVDTTLRHGDTINTAQTKLKTLRALIDRVKGDIQIKGGPSGVGVAPPSGATPPPAATGPAGATGGPGPEWTMVNGVLHHNGQPY